MGNKKTEQKKVKPRDVLMDVIVWIIGILHARSKTTGETTYYSLNLKQIIDIVPTGYSLAISVFADVRSD